MESLKDQMNASAMAGRGGAQAHRIAAQADREYILTHDGPAKDADKEDAGVLTACMSRHGRQWAC